MTYDEFIKTLSAQTLPEGQTPILKALWYDARNDWEAAHTIAQSREGSLPFDRLHAYLHRKEGDQWNAGYWYRRAGVPVFSGSLADEWETLVRQELA